MGCVETTAGWIAVIEIQWPIEIRESVFVVSVYGERGEGEGEGEE